MVTCTGQLNTTTLTNKHTIINIYILLVVNHKQIHTHTHTNSRTLRKITRTLFSLKYERKYENMSKLLIHVLTIFTL